MSRAIDEIFAPVLRALEPGAAATLARRKLRLMASAPAVLNHEMLREIEAVIASTLDRSTLPKSVPPALAARSLVAATFGALLWWAENGAELSPVDATLGALRALKR